MKALFKMWLEYLAEYKERRRQKHENEARDFLKEYR